ncbi:hypothetical protein X777_03448 [Ooceraea biroi]|uniref:Uncharacterized protein n=1 Tax=Ooceraea biroi TaxID=2015173 RepID=A0A026VSE1_OOCBI|nr:hypothetical protein X777_03448 [Ooceraea biroi]
MQHALEDTHFDNLEEVRKFVDEWINFYRGGIDLLPERWEKIIEKKKL